MIRRIKRMINDCFMNDHYFKGFADGITYLTIAFAIPIILTIIDMCFQINSPMGLLFSTMILTLSLGRDYFSAFGETGNRGYLKFGILLVIQFIFGIIVFALISNLKGNSSIIKYLYIGFCILSSFCYSFPFLFFCKDVKDLSHNISKKKGIGSGPMSNNKMAHGIEYEDEIGGGDNGEK